MNVDFTKLNPMQIEAVMHDKGPLLILAGAGSGKTRVLTHRIAYLIGERGVSPYRIIALTFTNKAAGEMKERVESLVGEDAANIWVSTFHSSCVRILRRFIDLIGYQRDFTIYDTDDQLSVMKDVCRMLNIDTKNIKEKAILNAISHAKDELIGPDEYEKDAGADPMMKKYAACYREYQTRLKKNNALDFDDLIFKTVELFRTSREALDYYRRRFEYIMVDEYQDTNSAQFMLIRLLAEHTNDDGIVERNLCVVGDDDQSIYKFRGANIRNILDFEKCYLDAKVIRLEQNYRSTKNILDVANNVIHNNIGRKDKSLWTENEQGESVRYQLYANDSEEAQGVVSEIYNGVRGGDSSYSDYAILYRTNAQSRSFEEKLIYRNIPYKIIGGLNFYQRKEIKDMLAYLRTIESGTDSVAVKRIINVPKRGIGAATLDRVEEYAQENDISFFEALERAPFINGISRALNKIQSFVALISGLRGKLEAGYALKDMIDEILEGTQYIDYLAEEDEEEKLNDRIDNINELISKMAAFEDSYEDDGEEGSVLKCFLDEVSLVADIDGYSEDTDMVVLMTIHSAKGLEFPNVFLVGMEEGIFPGYMSINADNPAEEIEEERRLCYVGMTRAMKQLTLSAAKQRMMRGEIQFNRPSRFIGEVPRFMLQMSGDRSSQRLSDNSDINRRYGGRSSEADSFDGLFGTKGGGSRNYSGTSQKQNLDKSLYKYGVRPATDIGAGPATAPEYSVGDTVRHLKFGTGIVKDIVKGGRDYEVTVEFPGGTRKMLASFAKLVKV